LFALNQLFGYFLGFTRDAKFSLRAASRLLKKKRGAGRPISLKPFFTPVFSF